MTNRATTMVWRGFIVLSLLAIINTAWAYNDNYSPFHESGNVQHMRLDDLSPISGNQQEKTKNRHLVFTDPEADETTLRVSRKQGAFYAEVVAAGAQALPPTRFSEYDFRPGLSIFSGDLNRDESVDFVIYSFSGGCGLACGYCNVAFVLSAGDKYELTSVVTLFPEPGHFVVLDDRPRFIHTCLLGVEECNDGKHHNFWIYNILAFQEGEVTVANDLHPDFPKTVWYTYKPNHQETTIISDEQKSKLRERSLNSVFWEGSKSNDDETNQRK